MKRIVVVGAGFGGLEAVTRPRPHVSRRSATLKFCSSATRIICCSPRFSRKLRRVTPIRAISCRPFAKFADAGNSGFAGKQCALWTRRTGSVIVDSGAIEYDALVLASGSRTEFFNTPGARENCWDYKSLQQAVELRERIIDLCEHADHTADAAARRSMLTFVVVGGGYTGIELVTEMRDFLFGYAAKKYRGIDASEIRLIVLEATPDVLRGIGPKLAAHARKRLHVSGIEVRTSTRVTRVLEDSVEINGNETLAGGHHYLDGGSSRIRADRIAARAARSHRPRCGERAPSIGGPPGGICRRRFGRGRECAGSAARRSRGHRAGPHRGAQHRTFVARTNRSRRMNTRPRACSFLSE